MAIIRRKQSKKNIAKLKKALAKERKQTRRRPEAHLGREHFSWIAPEYIKHEKGAKWYLVAGLLALFCVIYGLFTNSWTFSLVIIVFCGVYYLQHFEHPENVKISICQLGIKIGRKGYQYRNIRAFWIYYRPGEVETLNLLTTDKVSSEVSIQLNGENPADVRNYLIEQIPEWEGKEESLTDALIRVLKI